MKHILSLCLFLCMTIALTAEPVEIDMDSAIARSLEYNIGLKISAIDLDLLTYSKDTRWNSFVPSLSLNGNVSRDNGRMLFGDSPTEKDRWSMSAGVSASWSLNSSAFSGYGKTMRDYEQGLITWENAVQQLVRDVKLAFYDLLVKKEAIRIAGITLENADRKYRQDDGFYRRGIISELVLLRSQLAYENARTNSSSRNLAYETALADFRSMLGFPREEALSLSGSLNTEILSLDAAELIELYLPQYRNIQSYYTALEELRIQRRELYISTYTPTFSAGYSVDFGNVFDSPAFSDTGRLQLSVSIPLDSFIPGTTSNSRFQTLEKRIEQRELELNQALDSARDDIYISVMQINNYAASIEAMTLNEAVAKRNYDLTYAAWQRGEIEYQSVIDAAEDLEDVRYRALAERYNYHSQLLNLEYKLGIRLAEGTAE